MLLGLGVLAAPVVAPYDPARGYREFISAPPMRPRLFHQGVPHAPFVYPIRLVDRLTGSYQENVHETRALPWFGTPVAGEPVFLLGADTFGRDVFSRLVHGGRISVGLALLSTAGAIVLGGWLGTWAGYRGGFLDDLTMRLADFILVLPSMYVLLVLRAMMPLTVPSDAMFALMAIIFVLVGWPLVARGVRAIVLVESRREYVLAAASLGATTARVLTRHLLPACTGYLLVQATLLLPAFILAEATLSYAGFGFADDVATWGTMLKEASDVTTFTRAPWMLAPAAAIFAIVLSANIAVQGRRPARAPSWPAALS